MKNNQTEDTTEVKKVSKREAPVEEEHKDDHNIEGVSVTTLNNTNQIIINSVTM